MSSDNWFAIQLLSAVFAALFAVAVATLLFIEAVASPNRIEKIRRSLRNAMIRVIESPIYALPDNLIRISTWLVYIQRRARRWALGRGASVLGWSALPCMLIVGLQFGLVWLIAALAPILVEEALVKTRWRGKFQPFASYLGDIGAVALAASGLIAFGTYGASIGNEGLSVLLAVAISPLALVVADAVVTFGRSEGSNPLLSETTQNIIYAVGLGVGFSLFATVAALALGKIAEPNAVHPTLSVQAISTNLLCDTFTLAGCGFLFRLRNKASGLFFLFFLIPGCAAIGVLFALLTALLAFWGTPDQLSISQIIHVLLGLSPTSNNFELGGYFFLVHTTFLPVLLYLFSLVFSVVLKFVAYIASRLFGLASAVHANPFKVMAALLAVFFAIFTGLSGVASVAKDRVSDFEKPNITFHGTFEPPPNFAIAKSVVASNTLERSR